MGRPNLFDFATSELSQDAFLCWLAAIADHEEPRLRDVGRSFIAWLWLRAKGEPVDAAQIRLLAPPRRQVHHIDILFEASVRDARVVFLIEDKTETSHHSGQLERYRSHFDPAQTVVPVYFKTGYHFGADASAAAAGYTVISLDDWCEFLLRHEPRSDIFEDYRAYVVSMRDGRRGALALLDTAEGAAGFKHDFVQYEYMRQLASRCPEFIGDSVTYKGRSVGGEPWTQHRFTKFRGVFAGSIDEVLFHRLDRRQQGWYLATRQYAVVKGNAEARAAKLRRLRELREAFKRAVALSGSTLTFAQASADHRGKNESEIGVLFFDGATNTPSAVLEQFPRVHREFVRLLQAPTGTPAQEIRLATIADPRLANVRKVGGGEGFAVFTATFEGREAVVIDSGTLLDLLAVLEPEEARDDAVEVLVFDSAAARDGYLSEQRYVRIREED